MTVRTKEVTVTLLEDRYDVLQYIKDHPTMVFCSGAIGELIPYDDVDGIYSIEVDPKITIGGVRDDDEWDALDNHTPFQSTLLDEFPELKVFLILIGNERLDWIVAARTNELAIKYEVAVTYISRPSIPAFV
jgi:hypothetical protein